MRSRIILVKSKYQTTTMNLSMAIALIEPDVGWQELGADWMAMVTTSLMVLANTDFLAKIKHHTHLHVAVIWRETSTSVHPTSTFDSGGMERIE